LKVSGFKGVSSTGILTFLRKLGGAIWCPYASRSCDTLPEALPIDRVPTHGTL